MLELIQPVLKLVIEQTPNLVFAAVAIYYLAKQNARAIDAMSRSNERQFALLERLCTRCVDSADAELKK